MARRYNQDRTFYQVANKIHDTTIYYLQTQTLNEDYNANFYQKESEGIIMTSVVFPDN